MELDPGQVLDLLKDLAIMVYLILNAWQLWDKIKSPKPSCPLISPARIKRFRKRFR